MRPPAPTYCAELAPDPRHQRKGELQRGDDKPGADEIGEQAHAQHDHVAPDRRLRLAARSPETRRTSRAPVRRRAAPAASSRLGLLAAAACRFWRLWPSIGSPLGAYRQRRRERRRRRSAAARRRDRRRRRSAAACVRVGLPSRRVRAGSSPSIGDTTTIDTRRLAALPSGVAVGARSGGTRQTRRRPSGSGRCRRRRSA